MPEPLTVNTKLYGKDGESVVQLSPETKASQVYMPDIDGNNSNVSAEIIALRQKIAAIQSEGVVFKGIVDGTHTLPTVSYKKGWQYMAKADGTYAGKACEVGDMILCITDYASGTASDADWAVLQVNIVGAVSGPSSAVAQHVATFTDTSGKNIGDSGFTIGASVPANAQFTDTTYGNATDEADGLLSASLHAKLVGIEQGADKTDTENVSAAGAFMKATDTADSISDGTNKVVMTAAERTKLSDVAAGAEVNQNAVANVKVGSTTITASAKTDTVELVAGEGITLTASTSNKSVTVAEKYVDACIVSSLDNVPANLRNGGLVILKS